MAELAGNDAYLSLDGVDVGAYVTEVSMERSANNNETTAGFGTDHITRSPGLKDTTFSITLVYEVDDISTYIQKLDAGDTAYTLIYGPEGNTGGKPKHEQDVIIDSVSGGRVNVQKEMTVFEISAVGADAPTTDIYAGGTF